MLNPFPQLLVFGFFAPTLLRVVAACVFFYLARTHLTNRTAAAKDISSLIPRGVAQSAMGVYVLLEFLIALGLFLGFWTQIAALIGLILCIKNLFIKQSLHELAPLSRIAYVLLGVMCLSLLLTGAGAIAFDLPL